MNSIILLTTSFPFGRNESFIENEIEILSNHFEEVLIISCDVNNNINNSRNVPSNVKVIRINSKSKLFDFVNGIRLFCFPNEDLKTEFENCKNIGCRLFASYFESKSRRIYNEALDFLKKNNLENKNIIIYSYWLFAVARVGTLIKSDFKQSVKFSFSRAHGYDIYENRVMLDYLPMRKKLLNDFDMIYPCSYAGEKYLKDKYSDFRNKISVSLLGTKDFGLNKRSTDDVFRIVTCSRLEKLKRIDMLINSLHILDGRFKIEWIHIGEGLLKKSLEKKAQKSLKHIKYSFYGSIPNSEVMKFYQSHSVDTFINISTSEGLPVSIMEAISFGIPIIATNVGGNSEIVENNNNGVLISNDFSAEELAKIIEKFIVNKYDIESFRINSRKKWELDFQATVNYNHLYNKILKDISKKNVRKDLISNEYTSDCTRA